MSANWGNPTTSSLYADFVAQVKERDEDLARAFDPAVTSPTNYPVNTVRWTSAANRWEKWNGSAWGVLSSGYAINITGSATNITGVAVAANGGTGQSSYTIGDILFASGAAALSKLAAVATGNVMISGGAATAPSWGKVGPATHVSGTLAVGNGGTGVATLAGVAFGNGTGAFTAATAAQLVAAIGATAVTNATSATNLSSAGASTISAGGAVRVTVGTTGNVDIGASAPVAGPRNLLVANYSPDAAATAELSTGCTGASMSLTTAKAGYSSVLSYGGPLYVGTGTPGQPLVIRQGGVDCAYFGISGEFRVQRPQALGYGTGAGGTVTQATSKSTAVTLNTPTGVITTHNSTLASLAGVPFRLNNSTITASSVVVCNAATATSKYLVQTYTVQDGFAEIRIANMTGGSLSEAVPINFVVLNGAPS